MYQSQIRIVLLMCVAGLALDGYIGTHSWAVGQHGVTYVAMVSAFVICLIAFWMGQKEAKPEYPTPFNVTTEHIVGIAGRCYERKCRVTGANLIAFTLYLPAPAYWSHLCKELWRQEGVAAHECEFGFWTSKKRFVTCIQAREIAFVNGQLGFASYTITQDKPLEPTELW